VNIRELTTEEIKAISYASYKQQMALVSAHGRVIDDLYMKHKLELDKLGDVIAECINELIRRNEEGAK
jgi:hypothetical protein